MTPAYIDKKGKSPNGFYYAEVVSEQDYHDGGPHAHSYRAFAKTQDFAVHACEYWCHENGYAVVPSEEITG